MSDETDIEFYDREFTRLVGALRAKGPDCLTRALLTEVEEAQTLIALKPKLNLFAADSVLRVVRSRLGGTLTADECKQHGETLERDLQAQLPLIGKESWALADYQHACASLTTVEDNEDSPYFVGLRLLRFTRFWTGCSEAVAQREQLDHLQAALESRPLDSLPIFGQRNRNSLLAT